MQFTDKDKNMLEIIEVKSRKEQKEFLDFPLKMYKNDPCFVPPLYISEKEIFSSRNPYNDTCDHTYFSAYKDGKMVGRISVIIQKAYNKKNNEKRARFTRFDCIDDQEVANALFEKAESWAKDRGMDTICGPLGFSDLEREGLLIEGFDQLSTFEEQYNFPYYKRLIENLGYEKEVDWTESKLNVPDDYDGSLEKMADYVMKRNNLHIAECKNINEFIDKYADDLFELIDKSYDHLYGTVPFTKAMKDDIINSFKLIVSIDKVAAILDENDKMICFGICFPSISKAVQKSSGHLTPFALIRLLKTIKNPDVLDLGLIGVDPEYMNRGISVVISANLMKMLSSGKYTHAETNLNLENNYAIQNQWKRFKEVKHKRRRAYIKKLI